MITAYNPQVVAAERGLVLLENVQYTHPEDWYLSTCLCFNPLNHEYVVFMFNAKTGGFEDGIYRKNIELAVNKLKERCRV